MGYRSEVAYAIIFKSTEDRDKILSRITPEQQEIIKQDGEAIIREDRILFHADGIKWYLSRELGQYDLKGYDVVDAHDALIEAAKEAEDAFTSDADDPTGVYSMGVFLRLGEDDSDTERETWGEYNVPEGFPDLWDLIDYRREITVGW